MPDPRESLPAARRLVPSYMFSAMFWPLIGAFIAFVLFAIFMGWLTGRGGDADGEHH